MWSPDVAREKLKGLLRRYLDTNIIWSASDELALATSKVIKNHSDINVTIGGIGWLPKVIKAVKMTLLMQL